MKFEALKNRLYGTVQLLFQYMLTLSQMLQFFFFSTVHALKVLFSILPFSRYELTPSQLMLQLLFVSLHSHRLCYSFFYQHK